MVTVPKKCITCWLDVLYESYSNHTVNLDHKDCKEIYEMLDTLDCAIKSSTDSGLKKWYRDYFLGRFCFKEVKQK